MILCHSEVAAFLVHSFGGCTRRRAWLMKQVKNDKAKQAKQKRRQLKKES
jgi:hypothetical protein